MECKRRGDVLETVDDESGATIIEYAIAVALIGSVMAGAVLYAQRGTQDRAVKAARMYETYNLPDPGAP